MLLSSMPSSRLLVTALILATAPGCGFFRRLAGNDTVSLAKAEVKSMSVDLRRQVKTICPRDPVQMGVFAEVVLEGDKAAKQVETYQGHSDANKNDKLDFKDFAFASDQGRFDEDGWFTPNPNLLLTVGKEFEIKSVFRLRPDKFSFATTYKPDYTCIKGAGAAGSGGSGGREGNGGSEGRQGASGSSSQAGGDGGDAGSGTQGGSGTDGAPGPHLVVYATMVKTAFYPKLVALTIDGDGQDFLLVPEGQPVTIRASGGPGGAGGRGGRGGHGGSGGAGNPGGKGGRGGAGAHGGSGGNGGSGGAIELVFDSRFPDLKTQVRLDVSGGAAGPAGAGGGAGPGGSGGSGQTPPGSSGYSPPQAQSGSRGPDGSSGADGTPGRSGAPGRASVSSGAVKDKFGKREGVTVL